MKRILLALVLYLLVVPAVAGMTGGLPYYATDLNLNGNKVTNAAPGVAASDLARVDQVVSGVVWLSPIASPYVKDDSLVTPPDPCTLEAGYIADATAGVWVIGHLYECTTASPAAFTDVLGRALITGDRFGITFNAGTGAAGSFTGKDKYTFQVTGGAAGAYTYSEAAPVSGNQVTVTGTNAIDFAHVYAYSGTTWVDTSGGASLRQVAGNGLQTSGNTMLIDTAITVDVSTAQTLTNKNLSSATNSFPATLAQPVNNFRLTTETGVPVSTTDQIAKTQICASPYDGNQISLYSGTAWLVRTSAEFCLALGTLTANLSYDVFAYDNAGTPTLELTAWTNDTTRATDLVRQDGILSKTGVLTRRYLGTLYTTSTTTTEDSENKRYLWNMYNRVDRSLVAPGTTTLSYTYSTDTWRLSEASTLNQAFFVVGVAEDAVSATAGGFSSNSAGSGTGRFTGIGYDSVTATSANSIVGASFQAAGELTQATASVNLVASAGHHYLSRLERSNGSGTTTWYSELASAPTLRFKFLLTGTIRN